MIPLDIQIPFPGAPLDRRLVTELDACGYGGFWTAEASAADGVAPLAAAAAWAPGARIGTAILPATTRGPGLLAMTAATLADLSGGRFTLGIGSSTPAILRRWNDRPDDQAYRRVRDVVRFLRLALTGARVDERFDTFRVEGFRLVDPPTHQPPILLAALRPRMLRLAGTEADGAILAWVAPEDLPGIAREVGPGRQLVVKLVVCPDADEAAFDTRARRLVAEYLNLETYAEQQRWLGRGPLLAPMQRAWAAGDRTASLAAVPEALLDALFVRGSVAECQRRIETYLDAGATSVVATFLPFGVNPLTAARAMAPSAAPTPSTTSEQVP